MPVVLERRSSSRELDRPPGSLVPDRRREPARGPGVLDIGLLNNMPDAALRATERQFVELLGAAADAVTVRLHLFSLPSIERGKAALSYLGRGYGGLRDLTRTRLDALIVTGSEPRTAALVDEPYWAELTAVVDWAEHNTASTVWSCLAAHAAVLHLDGIGRHRLPHKRFGLFECAKLAEHPLLEGTPTALRVPHSRWNDLREGDLRAHGYRVLTRSLEAGVDTFAKQWRSSFIFLQGHPEYGADTLYREFRRDTQRYRDGERDTPPELPVHYLDPRSERGLAAALKGGFDGRGRSEIQLPMDVAFRSAQVRIWRESAMHLYRNWLGELRLTKS